MSVTSVWRWSPSIMAVDMAIDMAVGKVSLLAHIVSEKDIVHRVLAGLIGLSTEIVVEGVSALVLANSPLIQLTLSALMKLLLQLAMFKLMTSLEILRRRLDCSLCIIRIPLEQSLLTAYCCVEEHSPQ